MLSANESYLVEMEEHVDLCHEEEVDLSNVINPREGPSGISMHVFEGEVSPSTIRIEGYIKSQSVSILVDSSSTHNFMHSGVAKHLQLTIYAITPFQVATSGGEKLTCDKVCRVV